MKPRLLPLGDSALLIQFGDEIDPGVNQRVHELDALLQSGYAGRCGRNSPGLCDFACFIMIRWF